MIMKTACAFLAEGFEEAECLTVMDLLVRSRAVKAILVSISSRLMVRGSHGFQVLADTLLSETDFSSADLFFLPGGVIGVENLSACTELIPVLKSAAAAGKRLAAVCAGPSVLARLGLLNGKKATCHPLFADKMPGALLENAGVVTDGLVTTGRGLGWCVDMGLELVRLLVGDVDVERIRTAIQYKG